MCVNNKSMSCENPEKFLKNYRQLGKKKNVHVGDHPTLKKKIVVLKSDVDAAPIFNIMKRVHSIVPQGVTNPICHGKNHLYTEFVKGKTLNNYLQSKPPKKHVMKVIYSVLHTLHKLRKALPKFRHNDLHLDNVMVDLSPTKSPKAKIIDFGLATISGGGRKYDNTTYSTKSSKDHYKGNWGIYNNNDHRYDIHFFLNCLLGYRHKDHLPPNFVEFVHSLVPPEYRGFGGKPLKGSKDQRPPGARYNLFNYRLQPGSPKVKLGFPNISSVLSSEYFDGIVSWYPSLERGKISPKEYRKKAVKSNTPRSKIRKTLEKYSKSLERKGLSVDKRIYKKRKTS